MNYRKKNFSGLTLIEVVISSALIMVMMSLISGFLWQFKSYSNETMIRSAMQKDLDLLTERLKRQILPARSILNSYSPPESFNYQSAPGNSDSTGPKKIIFTVPVYNKLTFMPASPDPLDTNLNDVIIIEFDCRRNPDNNSLCDSSPEKAPGELKLWYIPAPGADYSKYIRHPEIKNQTLISYLADPDNAGIKDHSSSGTSELNTYPIFSFMDQSNISINDYPKTAVLKINLYAKKSYGRKKGNDSYAEKRELEVKLRNF